MTSSPSAAAASTRRSVGSPLVAGPVVVLAVSLVVALGGAVLGGSSASAAPDSAPGLAALTPPGGADPDTPGTSASVGQRTVEPGATISYRASGFPAGEIVNIKIDDGNFCSESGVHGACVVAQQRIPATGVVIGSLALPRDLGVGAHWLRFLASEEVTDADGEYVGVKGYTARGNSDFTVVKAADTQSPTPSPTPSSAQASDQATTSGRSPETSGPAGDAVVADGDPDAASADSGVSSDEVVAAPGAVLTAAPPAAVSDAASEPTAPVESAPAESAAPAAATVPVVTTASAASRFPYVGAVGLLLLLALAIVVVRGGRRTGG